MRGSLVRRGKQSWAVVLYLGKGPDGKKRQRWVAVKGTKADAERELAKLTHEFQTGVAIEPTRMTVGEFLGKWLEAIRPSVAAKTYERYAEIVRCHLVPALGHIPLAKLAPLHVQGYYAEAQQSGRRAGSGGLSARTVLHHHRVLRAAIGQAVRWQLVPRNVVEAVGPPRPATREIRALDEGETGHLLQALRGTPFWLPTLLAVTTGMRRGEVLGLRWSDVNLQTGTASVRQSLEETRAGVAVKAPKTTRGRRRLTLPSLTVEALQAELAAQRNGKSARGVAHRPEDFVCARADGTSWTPDEFSRQFGRAVRRAGLPPVTFHQLRHSHASQLLKQGTSVTAVSARLGHASAAITMSVYAHCLAGEDAEAARRIDEALRMGGV